MLQRDVDLPLIASQGRSPMRIFTRESRRARQPPNGETTKLIRLNYHCRSPRNESASPARAGQRRWSAIASNQAIKPTSNVSTNQNFQ